MRGLPPSPGLSEGGVSIPEKSPEGSRFVARTSLAWLMEAWKERGLDKVAVLRVLEEAVQGARAEVVDGR